MACELKARPVIPRELACRDVGDAISHYLGQGSAQAAFGFIDSLAQAIPAWLQDTGEG